MFCTLVIGDVGTGRQTHRVGETQQRTCRSPTISCRSRAAAASPTAPSMTAHC